MIDWLDFTLEIEHRPIEQGCFMVVDHDGTISRQNAIRRRVEGSYSSSIGVASITPDPIPRNISPDAIPYFVHREISKRQPKPGHCSHIQFSGNPTKFLQGHNVFGVDCIKTLAYRTVETILPQLGFDDFFVQRALQKVSALDFQVSRIDITKMFSLGTDEDVQNYLYMLPHTVKARGDRCDNTKGTFYVGKTSPLWTLKFYNKYRELMSRSKHHRLPDSLKMCGIEEFAKGQLRVELTLRKLQLDRYNLTHAKFLQNQLNQLYIDHAGKIDMTNQSIQQKRLLELSNTYQGTYALWKAGHNLQTVLSHNTFYRHRRKFLEFGIDIAKPPIQIVDRKASIEPIVKHLVPREVIEIPTHLQKYLVKLAA